ncbi:MAG: hypothetical protein JXA04_06595 [Gammaproteobacteria bacterium]|nr:hypothetical protein [Gammaproteobacteria bacterium]
MIGLAQFVMRGRSQAVLVISVFALFGLPVWPLLVFSGAALTLVTLSNQLNVTLSVLAFAYLFCTFILVTVGAFEISFWLLVFWVLVLISAEVLRRSKNLALAMLVVLIVVSFGVLVFFAVVSEPIALWHEVLTQNKLVSEFAAQIGWTQEQIDLAAVRMTGIVAFWSLLVLMTSLLIGRWCQGRLVNPGGFRREFHNLRLGRILSIIAVLSVVVAEIFKTQLMIALSVVLVSVYLFQGLAVIHAFTADQTKRKLWLVVFYILLLMFPQIVVMVSLWGIADAWLDSRRRWLEKSR